MLLTSKASTVFGLLVAAAILYLAREVLIPLALAILLSFLLAPAVRRLERWKFGRVPSVLLVVLLGFAIIGAVVGVAANQAVSLAAKLPEYRTNITKKIHAIRTPSKGDLGKAAEAIKDLQSEAAPERPPIAVKETPGSPFAAFVAFIAPVAKPAATTLAVIVFTILMLLHRENMRERVIGIIGAGRITVTTQAMGEASYRVSRYLFMQLIVNAGFGIPFGIALYFIGVPNAMLWGMLATVLRFIPYAGVWIAVAMPAALAFAISNDWSMVIWTLGVFLALEILMVNAVEPFVYGRSAGLSPIAIIIAALFWTWLWGPVGLLLATPLTVCVVVMGRYIPELGFLNMLLGVEPVLSPEVRLAQRLIAEDQEEALDLAEKYVAEHDLATLFDQVLMPAIALIEHDRHQGLLDEGQEHGIFEAARHMVEEIEERKEKGKEHEQDQAGRPAARPPEHPSADVTIVAAHDEGDHLAALVLARLLPRDEFSPRVIGFPVLKGEAIEEVVRQESRLVCISAVPPEAVTQAAYYVKRLRRRLPEARIVVGLWTLEDVERSRERLTGAGADAVVTRLADAISELRQYAAPVAVQMQEREPLPA